LTKNPVIVTAKNHLYTIKAIERGDSLIPNQNLFYSIDQSVLEKKFKIILKGKEE
jgi:hypothetical protein